MKDKAVLFAWIAGILLLISVLWIISQSAQTHYLLRAVNNVFINNNDSRRLSVYMQQKPQKTGLFGHWYLMNNSDYKMFVFAIFNNGILIPLGAIISADGAVQEVLPLSAHAVQVFDILPASILQIYISRIEEAALQFLQGDSR